MNTIKNNAVTIEALETRTLMSTSTRTPAVAVAPKAPAAPVVPLVITQNGSTLNVNGTTGNDTIAIAKSGNTYTIKNGAWTSTVTGVFTKLNVYGNEGNDSIVIDKSVTINSNLYGGNGNDSITGGAGNDNLFGGAGSNVLNGGAGNDTIVAIGSTADSISGGAGSDSFWIDYSRTEVVSDLESSEVAAGHFHQINTFANGASKTAGAKLADPALTQSGMAYQNFASSPLFSDAGPAEDDIAQGYVGDCWYLSSLSSVAKTSADRIRQSVVDMGDGTFAVQFKSNGSNVFYRVDADFATWYNQMAYANTGKGGSLWVAVMEKAMAEFRGQTASYANIDGGWMSDAYSSLGLQSTDIWGATSGTDLVNKLKLALQSGKAVTFAVGNPGSAPLIGSHAYTVDHVNTDGTLTLRNPWGVDGAGNDGHNDGYVTITAAQAMNAFLGASVATV